MPCRVGRVFEAHVAPASGRDVGLEDSAHPTRVAFFSCTLPARVRHHLGMTRLHDLWRRARRPDAAADGELLRRFDRAGDEAAFAELVARYGPVVYGACRRL